MTQKTEKQEQAKRTTPTSKSAPVLTAEERAAMKELAKERKAQARGEDGESAVLGKIAEMPEPDRAMAERFHAIVKASAPFLAARTYYGMPVYARDGKVVCFLQSAAKQGEVCDGRFQRKGEARRRQHVAHLLRAERAALCRGGDARRACEEGGQLSPVSRLFTAPAPPSQMRIPLRNMLGRAI